MRDCSLARAIAGFTLVELLIVISIVALTTSLVAPIGIKQIERVKIDSEWISLQRTMEGLSFRAFAQGRVINIEAEGTRLAWRTDGGRSGEILFDKTFFVPEQRIIVTRNGYAEPDVLHVSSAGRTRDLRLNGWLQR